MKTVAIVVLCLFGTLMADATQFCHYKRPMQNFDMNKFMGKWWWNMETPNVYSKRGDHCPLSEIYVRENGTIAFKLHYIGTGTLEYTYKEGNIYRCSSSNTDGKIVLAMPTGDGYWDANWWILGTDYENYIASYACWFAADGSYRAWAMGWCRQKECSEEHRNAIKGLLQEQAIDPNTLEDLPTNCPDV